MQTDPIWHRDSIGSLKPMQESSRGADHGSNLRLYVSLYAGNCSEHVYTLLIGYRSGGTPGFHTFSGRVTEIAGRRRGSSASSALATSRLFVLPVVARRWVSVDNNRALACKPKLIDTEKYIPIQKADTDTPSVPFYLSLLVCVPQP